MKVLLSLAVLVSVSLLVVCSPRQETEELSRQEFYNDGQIVTIDLDKLKPFDGRIYDSIQFASEYVRNKHGLFTMNGWDQIAVDENNNIIAFVDNEGIHTTALEVVTTSGKRDIVEFIKEKLLELSADINEEITRKRDEFGLETLDKTKKQTTLAVKRMQEAEAMLNEIKASTPIYNDVIDPVLREIRNYETEDYGELYVKAEALRAKNPQLLGAAADKLVQAAIRLEEYENYK